MSERRPPSRRFSGAAARARFAAYGVLLDRSAAAAGALMQTAGARRAWPCLRPGRTRAEEFC
ncbi:MAG: hypothetical protein HYU25_06895 [Candidatus Rokubacteria bacterium]|nr:hypothetical protein [Candidatus Rokubacteria bacterium]